MSLPALSDDSGRRNKERISSMLITRRHGIAASKKSSACERCSIEGLTVHTSRTILLSFFPGITFSSKLDFAD